MATRVSPESRWLRDLRQVGSRSVIALRVDSLEPEEGEAGLIITLKRSTQSNKGATLYECSLRGHYKVLCLHMVAGWIL